MFTSSNKLRMESMISSDSSNDTVNLIDMNIIKYTLPTILNDDNESIWENIKIFFTPHNSMIILAIICLIFFLITLCLVFIILQLLKKKRFYQNQTKSTTNNHSKFDHYHRNFPSSPIQMGLTSNQIPSLGNILPTNKDTSSSKPIISSTSAIESTKTQSFDNFENELKRTWNEKGLTSSNNNDDDDEIETVNEVLGMEERNGKVYYKVNFTGHPADYTAWVCEEDLIPE